MFPVRSSRLSVALLAGAMLVSLLPTTALAADPVAGDDSYVVADTGTTSLDVMSNDSDADLGDTPELVDVDPPANGTAVINGDQIDYTPDNGYHGPDTFDYTIEDDIAGQATATVTITVNTPPVANDDPSVQCLDPNGFGGGFPLVEDWIGSPPDADYFVFTTDCLPTTNDTDADGDALTWDIVDQPTHGDVVKWDEDLFGYRPDPDYGTPSAFLLGQTWDFDTFTYRVFDGLQYSSPATMSLWVADINDAPTFTAGPSLVSVVQDSGAYSGAWATTISPGPSSESAQNVTFEVDVDDNGVPNLFDVAPAIASDGTLTFTPAAGELGLVHVTVRATDDGGLDDWGISGQTTPDDTSGDVTFDIAVTSGPADAVDDDVDLDEDVATSPIELDVLSNDTVPSGYTVTAVTQGTLSAVSIAPGGTDVLYQSDADANGTDVFTYTLSDGLGDDHVATVTVHLAPVNDPPVGTDGSVSVTEDDDYTFTTGDFGFTDPADDPDGELLSVKITTLPGAGTLTNDGGAIAAGDFVTASDIDAAKLVFTPDPDGAGTGYASFTFQVRDDDGGDDLDLSANTMSIDVDGVNDAPAGTDDTIGITENSSHAFTAGDFGFTDPNDDPDNALENVMITTLPTVGTFENDGDAVEVDDVISAATIGSGDLVFTPAPGATGTGYATIGFTVQDDGGTANGGIDLDQTENTLTVNVTPINHAPAGADKTVTTPEDVAYALQTSDFGFTSGDTPANALLAVKVTTLPGAGTLRNDGSAVSAGAEISAADIAASKLTFTPALNASGASYTSFTFQVRDDGGTANGGVDLDQSANTITVNVTANNDAPAGANKTVAMSEEAGGAVVPLTYTFAQADFGFTDSADSPANTLLAVKITTLPGAGSLKNDGVAMVAGASVTAADITASKLVFTPLVNGNGGPYATFTFQVQDTGGTSDGGADLDPVADTITINVSPVQDPPDARTDATLAVPEGAGPTALAVLANDIEVDGETMLITSTTPPAHGVVAITGSGTGLTYDPAQLYYGGDSFTYTISDGHGGTDTATVVISVVKDTAPPVLGTVVQSYYSQTVGSSTSKARISWSGSDAGTAIASYSVQQSYQGGGYTTVALSSATSTSVTRTLTHQKSYRFRVRATDKNGNVSAWVYGPTFKPGRFQNTSASVAYSGAWTTKSNSKALAGSHRYSTSASAKASVTTSTQDFGLVMTKSSSSGSVQVWIDGVLATTLNLKKTTTAYRGLVFSRHFSSLGSHKIEIRPVGNGRVYLDAILILR